jgi:hypothetical protein
LSLHRGIRVRVGDSTASSVHSSSQLEFLDFATSDNDLDFEEYRLICGGEKLPENNKMLARWAVKKSCGAYKLQREQFLSIPRSRICGRLQNYRFRLGFGLHFIVSVPIVAKIGKKKIPVLIDSQPAQKYEFASLDRNSLLSIFCVRS